MTMHSQPPASEPRWWGVLRPALAAGGGGKCDAQSCCGSSTGALGLSLPYRSWLSQVLNHPTSKPLFADSQLRGSDKGRNLFHSCIATTNTLNMAKEFPEIQPGGSLILAWQVKGKKVLVVGGGEVPFS